jgi:HEPN domain-containing protein
MTGTGAAADWLEHAESDLAVARAAVGQRGVLPQQVAFHAQQAVEKALKAALVRAGVDFPRTHDLQELVELVAETDHPLPDELLEAVSLTPFAVQHRYPGEEDPPGEEEIRSALALADKAVAWARERLQGR